MFYILPIISFYISLIFILIAYINRTKKFASKLKIISLIFLIMGFVLFILWSFQRNGLF